MDLELGGAKSARHSRNKLAQWEKKKKCMMCVRGEHVHVHVLVRYINYIQHKYTTFICTIKYHDYIYNGSKLRTILTVVNYALY